MGTENLVPALHDRWTVEECGKRPQTAHDNVSQHAREGQGTERIQQMSTSIGASSQHNRLATLGNPNFIGKQRVDGTEHFGANLSLQLHRQPMYTLSGRHSSLSSPVGARPRALCARRKEISAAAGEGHVQEAQGHRARGEACRAMCESGMGLEEDVQPGCLKLHSRMRIGIGTSHRP